MHSLSESEAPDTLPKRARIELAKMARRATDIVVVREGRKWGLKNYQPVIYTSLRVYVYPQHYFGITPHQGCNPNTIWQCVATFTAVLLLGLPFACFVLLADHAAELVRLQLVTWK